MSYSRTNQQSPHSMGGHLADVALKSWLGGCHDDIVAHGRVSDGQ